MEVWFDPSNPFETAALDGDDWRSMGYWVLGLTGVVLLIAWIQFALIRKFRPWAALNAILLVVGIITAIVKSFVK